MVIWTGRKSQSAMEYLMTYGWAILIIAVVLGAIYSLGLFNPATLGPKAAPGTCQVYRPNGPFTTQYISLAGSCTNELPQYVAQFNGASSAITATYSGLPLGSSSRSFFAWIYFTGPGASDYNIFSYGNPAFTQWLLFYIGGGKYLRLNSLNNNLYSSVIATPNVWHFVGYTYSAGATSATIYMDSQVYSGPLDGANALNTGYYPTVMPTIAGPGVAGSAFFPGSIADMQIYNSSLDANSVKALYQEGIGGAPINLQSLVAWWPLNGNSNDYSGDLNNGVPVNVIYTNQWLSGYTIP